MVAPHAIDTTSPDAVAEAVKSAFAAVGAEDSQPFLDSLFDGVTSVFEGRYPGYQPIDMLYHDYEHTLQVALCLTHMLEGRRSEGASPVFQPRDWELAVISALLHDTGFLKKTGDDDGSGAKYTFVHERRSCDFARAYLPGHGITGPEIEDICSAIMCTGPRNDIRKAAFQREEARQIALVLVTADYLAQMSASNYLEKLPHLYQEFEEAFELSGTPPEKRPYNSLEQLLEMTPGFWRGYVSPLLENEACGAYRYLSANSDRNPYLDAVEANLAELERRLRQ